MKRLKVIPPPRPASGKGSNLEAVSVHSLFQEMRNHNVDLETSQAVFDWTLIASQNGVAPIYSLGHLAHQTGVPYATLRGVVERSGVWYTPIESVSKKNGKKRRILTPHPDLMEVQGWLLRNSLAGVHHNSSYAYTKGRGAIDCAKKHIGSRWMLKVDLHDFYFHCDESDVYQTFVNLGYSSLVSFELARLCTTIIYPYSKSRQKPGYKVIDPYSNYFLGVLPQGSPTSGALANSVAGKLDDALFSLALKRGFLYTRYSDDMIFSTSALAVGRSDVTKLLKSVRIECARQGFYLHEKKNRIISPGSRKIALGLVVGEDRLFLPAYFKEALDHDLWAMDKYGVKRHSQHRKFSSEMGFLSNLWGRLTYAKAIEPDWTHSRFTKFNDNYSMLGPFGSHLGG